MRGNEAVCAVVLAAIAGAACGAEPSFRPLGCMNPDYTHSLGRGVSGDGSVVVGTASYPLPGPGSGTVAFRWTEAGGMQSLGELPGGSYGSYGYGVSADGLVLVGKSYSGLGQEAFRWSQAEGLVPLGDLPGGEFFSSGKVASADGSVIVGTSRSDNGDEGYIWTEAGGMQGVGDVPGGGLRQQRDGRVRRWVGRGRVRPYRVSSWREWL